MMNDEEKAKLKKELEQVKVEPKELRKLSSATVYKLVKRKQEIQKILAEVEKDST
jgi:hypothetical protein